MIEVQGIRREMIANNIEPFEPTHPGKFIKDEIECRKISQKRLSEDMGVAAYTVLNDIVNGRRSVNTKFALLCEAALGIPTMCFIRI